MRFSQPPCILARVLDAGGARLGHQRSGDRVDDEGAVFCAVPERHPAPCHAPSMACCFVSLAKRRAVSAEDLLTIATSTLAIATSE